VQLLLLPHLTRRFLSTMQASRPPLQPAAARQMSHLHSLPNPANLGSKVRSTFGGDDWEKAVRGHELQDQVRSLFQQQHAASGEAVFDQLAADFLSSPLGCCTPANLERLRTRLPQHGSTALLLFPFQGVHDLYMVSARQRRTKLPHSPELTLLKPEIAEKYIFASVEVKLRGDFRMKFELSERQRQADITTMLFAVPAATVPLDVSVQGGVPFSSSTLGDTAVPLVFFIFTLSQKQIHGVFGSNGSCILQSALPQLEALGVHVTVACTAEGLYRGLVRHCLGSCSPSASPAAAVQQRTQAYQGETAQLLQYAAAALINTSILYSLSAAGDYGHAVDVHCGSKTVQASASG
jgi:hypothetical protein